MVVVSAIIAGIGVITMIGCWGFVLHDMFTGGLR